MIRTNNRYSGRIIGLSLGFGYYLVGIIIATLVHYIYGWEYVHAPPLSFFVIVLVLLGGLIRAIWNIINIKKGKSIKSNKYELAIHTLPALGGLVLILMSIFIN